MIFSCGEALVDCFPGHTPEVVAGGGPLNAAIAASRLRANTSFIGGVSNDADGDMLWQHLLDNGVDVSLSRRFAAPTARATVEHVPQLRFRFEGNDTADTLLTHVDHAAVAVASNIVHGGTLGMFRGVTAQTLVSLAEAHAAAGGLVSLDPNVRPQIIDNRPKWFHFHDRWLAAADLYKGSDEDLAWIWPDQSPEESAAALLDGGVTAVILTRGAEGLTVLTHSGSYHASPPPINVVDTVGAGDTIAGTFLTCVAERFAHQPIRLGEVTGEEWQRYARRAVNAAAITCSRAGADVPRRHELGW